MLRLQKSVFEKDKLEEHTDRIRTPHLLHDADVLEIQQ